MKAVPSLKATKRRCRKTIGQLAKTNSSLTLLCVEDGRQLLSGGLRVNLSLTNVKMQLSLRRNNCTVARTSSLAKEAEQRLQFPEKTEHNGLSSGIENGPSKRLEVILTLS